MSMKLKKFSVKGYKSFNELVSLDFSDVGNYDFGSECINNGIITKAGIYGENGAGKSNFGYALFDIVSLLTDKHMEARAIDPISFLNADNVTAAAVFSYVFKNGGSSEYLFSYVKAAPTTLLKETFSVDDQIVYEYDYTSGKFNLLDRSFPGIGNLNFTYLDNKLSIFRYIANNTAQEANSPIRAIMDFVSHMLWFRSLYENGYIGYETGITGIDEWIINSGKVAEFNKFLHDVCNLKVEVEARVQTGADGSRRGMLIEKHRNRNLIFSEVFSSGTKAATLFYYWSTKFNDVSLLFLDEFDAYYHHTLALNIIKLVKEFPEMQVLFTTHNLYLMGNNILRPDCYFILSDGKLTSFENGTDREIREGHNLAKIYCDGEF